MKFDVVLLDGPPADKVYDLYMEGEQMSDIMFIPEGEKYCPFYYTGDFQSFSSTLKCVAVALSTRFEFNGK